MADSLQLDGTVLKLTNSSDLSISGNLLNGKRPANGKHNKKYVYDNIGRTETQQPQQQQSQIQNDVLLTEISTNNCLLPSQSLPLAQSSILSSMLPSIQNSNDSKVNLSKINNNHNTKLNGKKCEMKKSVNSVNRTTNSGSKKLLPPPPPTSHPIMDLEIDDLRKKRCTDRYDSSESSDR